MRKQKKEWTASYVLLPLSVFWKYNIGEFESRLSEHKTVCSYLPETDLAKQKLKISCLWVNRDVKTKFEWANINMSIDQ